MMAKHGHTDEEALTRGFDPRLVRRLLSWGRPYLGLVSFSVFIIVCWTGLDLAVPFLTKTAVDDYIQRESVVVDWSRATEELRATVHGEIGGKHFRRLDGKRELVRVVRLKELDPRNYRVLAQSKAIEETRYYFFRPADRQGPDREILSTLTQDPPQGSLRVDEGVAVPLPALMALPDETKEALRRPDNHGILVIVVFIIAALLLNFFLDYARIYTMQYVGQSIMFDMRTSVFQHIQRMSLSFFDRHPVGRLVTRMWRCSTRCSPTSW
jgi:ABC-type multidrug transport system fused ATPase/permease subunit